jgi:hypothetical protein
MNELTKKYEWSWPGCLRTETFWPTARGRLLEQFGL